MSREGALFKNTIVIAVGKICTQFVSFFLLPFYTGFLSTEEFGIVDLLNTLVSLLLPVVTFQVEQAVFRELIEIRGKEKEQREIISSAFFSVCLQCLVYFLVFAVVSPFIQNKYKIFLAVNVGASIFSSLFLQVARGIGNNSGYAAGSFLSAASTIVFNVLFLGVLRLGVNGMMIGTLLGQVTCIAYLFFSLHLFRYICVKSFAFGVVKKLWKYSLPLIPNSISWWVFNASDRLVVSFALGLSQNGILSAASKFSSAYIVGYNIFNISWTESVSLYIHDEDAEEFINCMFWRALSLFLAVAVGITACMPFVYPVMVSPKFKSGYGLVPILLLASVFNIIVGLISTVYVAEKDTKALANTSVISAVVNIVAHILLLPFLKIYAAAFSTLISFGVMGIYRLYDIRKRYLKIKFHKMLFIKTGIAFCIILTAYYMGCFYFKLISLFIAAAYAWDINRETLCIFWEKVKKSLRRN